MVQAHYRICLVAFLVDFAVMVMITVLPFFVFNQIGGGAAMSGTIGGAQAACYAIVCLVSAGFASRAKNGLTWAKFGVTNFAVFSCVLPMFRSPVLCGIIATVAIGSLGLVWPALHSWVGAEHDLKVRARRMSWFNISWSSGFAVSPLIAGPLYDLDYRLPFVLLLAICLFTIALLRSIPHEKELFGAASQEVIDARAEHDRASEAILYSAWCACLVGGLLASVTRNVYPKRVAELVASGQLRVLFEASPADFLTSGVATKYSWLAFALGLAAAISFLVMGRTHCWRHRFRLLLCLQITAAGAFWVLGNTRSLIVMMLCFAAVGTFAGVSFFAGVYYSMADPAHKHRRAAINESAVGIGAFMGSFVFGQLAGRYGLGFPFRYTPVLIALALLVQALLFRYGTRGLMAKKTASTGQRDTAG